MMRYLIIFCLVHKIYGGPHCGKVRQRHLKLVFCCLYFYYRLFASWLDGDATDVRDATDRTTEVLTEVQLTVISRDECREKIDQTTLTHPTTISRNTFCAGERNYSTSSVNKDAKGIISIVPILVFNYFIHDIWKY